MEVENTKNTTKDLEEVTATEAVLQTIKELADKCETIEEFREALARIIANK